MDSGKGSVWIREVPLYYHYWHVLDAEIIEEPSPNYVECSSYKTRIGALFHPQLVSQYMESM